jgi:flagellar protein FlaG
MDMGTLSSRVEAGVSAPATRTQQETALAPVPGAPRALESERNADPQREQVAAAVTEMQDYVQSTRRDLHFQLDDDSGRMIVRVTEAGTGEVIRQIPSEEAVRLAENLSDIRSLLFSSEA